MKLICVILEQTKILTLLTIIVEGVNIVDLGVAQCWSLSVSYNIKLIQISSTGTWDTTSGTSSTRAGVLSVCTGWPWIIYRYSWTCRRLWRHCTPWIHCCCWFVMDGLYCRGRHRSPWVYSRCGRCYCWATWHWTGWTTPRVILLDTQNFVLMNSCDVIMVVLDWWIR